MLFDWFAREGGVILSWWLLVSLAGAAAVPLALRLLGGLPDRGFTLARALGLLLVGFTFWLLAILGFIRNDTGGMALAYVVVAVIGIVAFFSGRERIDLRAWWKAHRSAIIINEIVFLVSLVAWAVYKAYVNDAFTTEKPMELAFLSGVMRSDAFPPNDPWFSGYAISYYYFGYVIAAMLSTLSGVTSAVGFSMIHALMFALTASSVFGVVYNLVRSRAYEPDEQPHPQPLSVGEGSSRDVVPTKRPGSGVAIGTGLLGVIFVLLLSNFVFPLVEIPYESGAAADYLSIWNMNERQQPLQVSVPGETRSLDDWGYWWWFRAARAISDRGLDGVHNEVIDEFPAFSFILSDNHPHVLSLPFSAMTIGLALNIILLRRRPNGRETFLYGLVIGGLIFLNTWDGAIYLILLVGAEGIRRLMYGGSGRLISRDWLGMVGFGASMLIIGVVAVFPFLVSFRSQLNGILPNVINPTGINQFFLQFAPFLLLLLPFLLVEMWRGGKRTNLSFGLTVGLTILLMLALMLVFFSVLGALIPGASDILGEVIQQNGGMPSALIAVLSKRLIYLPTALLLTLMLVLVAARLFPKQGIVDDDDDPAPDRRIVTYPVATGFALLLIALGAALTLTPEFVYLRDNFGSRMNTVFKFYYQAWLVWGIASAYVIYTLLADAHLRAPSPFVKAAVSAVLAIVLIAGLPYIAFAAYHRAYVENGRLYNPEGVPVTLNGEQSYMERGGTTPGDLVALACLSDRVRGDDAVVVQAFGNSYNGQYGIVGTLTGIPILFNWYGHQGQWRGNALGSMVGTRLGDIELIYTDPTWNTTREILDRYDVDYIFVGTAERREYGERLVNAEYKLRDNLEIVCESGDTRVYRVTEQALAILRP